jgi:hypothetical protein
VVVDLEREIIACLRNAVQFVEFGHKFWWRKNWIRCRSVNLKGCWLVLWIDSWNVTLWSFLSNKLACFFSSLSHSFHVHSSHAI